MTTTPTTDPTLDGAAREGHRRAYTNNEQARRHVHTVHQLRRELAAEYLRDNPNRATLADLHAAIGVNLKLAQVHATLAQHDAINDVVHALELGRAS